MSAAEVFEDDIGMLVGGIEEDSWEDESWEDDSGEDSQDFNDQEEE